MAIYQCESEPVSVVEVPPSKLDNSNKYKSIKVTKEELIGYIVYFDLISVAVFMYFIYKLIWMNKDKC